MIYVKLKIAKERRKLKDNLKPSTFVPFAPDLHISFCYIETE